MTDLFQLTQRANSKFIFFVLCYFRLGMGPLGQHEYTYIVDNILILLTRYIPGHYLKCGYHLHLCFPLIFTVSRMYVTVNVMNTTPVGQWLEHLASVWKVIRDCFPPGESNLVGIKHIFLCLRLLTY